MMKRLSPSTRHVLKAFIPYGKANLQLAYHPGKFFDELEKKSHCKERTLRSAYYRSIKAGLLELDDRGVPRLTAKGRASARPYKPRLLGKNAYLLVIFDIPEAERRKRNHLRAVLQELGFKKIQQSVWVSTFDHRELLAAEVREYGLESCVKVYESALLTLALSSTYE